MPFRRKLQSYLFALEGVNCQKLLGPVDV